MNGLQHMHKNGVYHRDLKPQNIMLSSKDENAKLKIADFGESASYDDRDEDYFETYVGTRIYMPPELMEL